MYGRRSSDEDGQVAPIVLVALVALAGTAVLFVQGGRMGLLAAEASTAADASALAALQVVHDELEGAHGIGFIASGRVPPPVEAAARSAAAEYAARNGAELTAFDVLEDERRRVRVRAETRTLEALGSPAVNDSIRTYRARSRGAAEVELAFREPGDRGCLTPAEVSAIAAGLGLEARSDSGLVFCGGADVRNLQTIMHEAVVRLEDAMGAPVVFTSAYRSLEEQLVLFLDPTVDPAAPPGASLHNHGLAFDAANHEAIVDAMGGRRSEAIGMCQPLPDNDAVHFSHVEAWECGGLLPGPGAGAGLLGIDVGDPRLIDPDTL